MKPLAFAAISGALLACGTVQDTAYRIAVHVESDPGVPLEGAVLEREHKELARSDQRGEISTDLRGKPGDRIQLDVTCPPGHRQPEARVSVLLRAFTDREARPEFQVRCPPLEREVVVAVRAQHGPNLPLRYLGREVARTDAAGVAHALLQATPGDTLTLTLDTSADDAKKLMPRDPEIRFSVPEHDELVVFDQAFESPKPKRKPIPKPPEPTGPQRI